MSKWPKEAIINGIVHDISDIHEGAEGVIKWTDDTYAETIEFVKNLIDQIPNAISNPLIPKTPKVVRKKDIKRIETIPEDECTQNVSNGSIRLAKSKKVKDQDHVVASPPRRGRRAAWQKAVQHIKAQQELGGNVKLRRPSTEEDHSSKRKPQRVSRTKRIKSIAITSDEEETERPKKYTKTKEKSLEKSSVPLVVVKQEPRETYAPPSSTRDETYTRPLSINNETYTGPCATNNETYTRPSSAKNETTVNSANGKSRNKRVHHKSADRTESGERRHSPDSSEEPLAKKANIVDETMDVTIEPSLYEDAVGKSIPMNSTMYPNCTGTFDRKMMNLTVVLESMPFPRKINETVTLANRANNPSSGRNTLVKEDPSHDPIVVNGSPSIVKTITRSKSSLQSKMKALKETLANKEFDALITEDESSPEKEEKPKTKKRTKPKLAEAKRVTRSTLLTEDDDNEEVLPTPGRKALDSGNSLKNIKTSYKPNALFSPYAKDSVKKRVEAFEQAGLQSPKAIDVDVPTRQTRTKTRAMAAAESTAVLTPNVQTIAQKLARKSLAKAKKISLQRQIKDSEESKENNITNSAQKPSRLLGLNEKIAQKLQQRTTPVVKSRLQTPMSVNRILNTPAGSHIPNQNKAQTTARANIVTSVDSFLPPAKALTKSNSTDNLADKRRKVNDEDAKRKKDEALKILCEEKRRKREEKELKNKLAREAKEKLDMEKRLKQEREREEKARVALLLQDKQREEFEKKRLLQLQRAQEKEERRKLEEQLRMQRLQEQEETERQLAEQKRREQDAERRKLAEARAQQAAANEAARLKCQYLPKKHGTTKQHEHQDPTSYKLDSEPDDDESDDESAPKHMIPHWAQPSVRSVQLAIQQYIPMAPVLQFFGTRRCTPDLTELFKGIKKERLERTSSAIWKTPPRYSMMTGE